MDQVISSRYGVMSVGLNTFNRILILKLVLVLHYLEDLFIIGHFLLAREKAAYAFLFGKLEPRVSTDVFNGIPRVRISIQNLSEKVGTLGRDEFRDLVVRA